jgi:phosphatidate phosphatase APP1
VAGRLIAPGWPARLAAGALGLLDAWRRARRGGRRPVEIHPYRGHGTGRVLYLRGRVLERPGLSASSPTLGAWRNLRDMRRRFMSAEVPGARVLARFEGLEQEVVADREGYFQVVLEPAEPIPPGRLWLPVELELLWPRGGPSVPFPAGGARAVGMVIVPQGADLAVVSDLDDTVIRTSVTHLWAMARTVLLGNAHTRLPFEGVAAFYRALRAGPDGRGANPVFYVSAGPWNLHDLIEEFLDLNGIPAGPLFMRDWGWHLLRGSGGHKLEQIRGLMTLYPDLGFVLIGDSGEHDPEIYRRVALDHPGRVRAVYIRDVSPGARRAAVRAVLEELEGLGVPALLTADSVVAARHARALGLVAPEAVPEVREERAADLAAPTPVQAALDPRGE